MPDIVRLQGLLAEIEATYKTDPTPAPSTDGVQVEELFWNRLRWGYREENLREENAQVSLGRAGLSTPAGRWAEIEVVTLLKGRASAFSSTNKPEMGVLLRACGLSETIDTTLNAEKAIYTPRSSGFESVTIYAYGGGLLWKVVGVRGNLTVSIIPGQPLRARFTLRGVLKDVSEASLPTIVYAAKGVTPPVAKGEGLTLNAYDPPGWDGFELDMQAELVELPPGNDADSHAGFFYADRNPQFTVQVERPALASFNPWTLRDAGTRFAWDIGPIGPAQYNKVKLSGPAGRIIDVAGSDREGLATLDLTIRTENSNEETANDAIKLEFV